MIDAALQYIGIPHVYEQPLRIGTQTIHPDFSLGHGIYVEYWGIKTKGYLKHKKKKQRLYKQGKYHLINIENEDLKNLLYILTNQLQKFQHFFPQFQNILNLSLRM